MKGLLIAGILAAAAFTPARNINRLLRKATQQRPKERQNSTPSQAETGACSQTESEKIMTIKTWEDQYNAAGIVSGHITDHMQAEITELRARVASDAITMMRLAGMSQDCALKAKGLEEHLEIAQGTLKNLRARVAELEAELATAKRGIECYAMQLAKDTVQSDIDCIMAQGVEIAQLKAELAAVRNQQPIGYLEKHLIESGRKIQLCNLTKTRLWADSVPVYLAAGAQPVPEAKTIATAPECLNTNDKAFWVTGWNECRKAMLAEAKELK